MSSLSSFPLSQDFVHSLTKLDFVHCATKLAKISDAVQESTKLDFVYKITAQKKSPGINRGS